MKRALLMLLLFFAPLSALAADFTGAWKLDTAASQSMDAILTLQDVSWAKRKAAEYLDGSVRIRQEDDRMVVTFDNVLGTIEQELVFTGAPHPTHNPAGMATTLSTRWEGETLVTTGDATSEEGVRGAVTERRSLSADGQTMTLAITVTVGDREASSRRVFRRAE